MLQAAAKQQQGAYLISKRRRAELLPGFLLGAGKDMEADLAPMTRALIRTPEQAADV